ncbi:MAG: prepilin-type N-terminal cleavage/methylation domain-containing protein [Pseudomonadales bacterium]|nr:prepilin-type N-terminal cleavage/methylation domain-containing protein [Pseudomonadales bacterium]
MNGGKGFTLVELLVAMALSGIMLSAMVKVFASNHSLYQQQKHNMLSIENYMVMAQLINRDVKNVKNWACQSNKQELPLLGGINDVFQNQGASVIWGMDNVEHMPSVINGSDVLYLLSTEHLTLKENSLVNKSLILSDVNVRVKDHLLLSDCKTTQVVKITGIKKTPDNRWEIRFNKKINANVDVNTAQVFQLNLHRYTLQQGINQKPALFLSINNKRAVELVADVNFLQLQYAVDTFNTQGQFSHRSFYTAKEMDVKNLWPSLRQMSIQLGSRAENDFEFTLIPGFSGKLR